MNIGAAIRSTFTSERLPGESRPTGSLDQLAGIALTAAAILYLYFDAFGGVIRMVFPSIGLTLLTYLPAATAVAALSLNALVRLGDSRSAIPVAAVLAFIVLEMALAVLLGRQIPEVLFAFYIWMPGLVVMCLCQRHMQDRVINAMVPVFFIGLFGVLLNIFIAFPWAGATYEVLGQQREAGREWSTFGQDRLGGFSRASFAASAHILLGYCALEHRLKSNTWRAIWWALSVVVIYYTTSKSPLLAIIALPLTYFIIGRIRQSGAARRVTLANLLLAAWVLLIFVGPFLALTFGPDIYPEGIGSGRSYSSLADRVLNTWPKAIGSIDWRDPVGWIVGRGMGGIGEPQAMFSPPGNPGDNLAIYLFVCFGLVSLVFGILIFRGGQRAILASGRGRRDFALIIGMLGIASAANVIECATTIMVLGLALARPKSRREVTDDPSG